MSAIQINTVRLLRWHFVNADRRRALRLVRLGQLQFGPEHDRRQRWRVRQVKAEPREFAFLAKQREGD